MKLTKLNSTKIIDVTVRPNIDWERIISKPQKKIKDFLKLYWQHDPVIEEFYIPGSKLRIDLFNVRLKIAVEVSPSAVHCEYNKFFHRNNRFNFLDKVKKDEQKRNWCNINNIRLVELYDDDIKNISWELFRDKYNIEL